MKRLPSLLLLLIATAITILLLRGRDDDSSHRPLLVATLPPLHSLAAGVMEGVGTPYLLLKGGANPHRYALRPSDAGALQSARVVTWIGPTVEGFLHRTLETLPGSTRVVTATELDGMVLLDARSGGAWPEHGEHEGEEDGDGEGDEHHDGIDGHLWLDPRNAVRIVDALAVQLADADPDHAARYRANADALAARLQALDAELAERLAPLRGIPYLVYHDAQHYFEARYGLTPVAAITASAESTPGARRIAEMRELLRDRPIGCLFTGPQFEPALAERVIEGLGTRRATLDPLGASLEPGPALYFDLMRAMADDLRACLPR